MKNLRYVIALFLITFLSCSSEENQADAYGNFEAIEIMVSAEAIGKILDFEAQEGDILRQGQVIVTIDSSQLCLKKKQLYSGMASLRSKSHTLDAQVKAQNVQLDNLKREKKRVNNLFEEGAATSKQQDDISGQVALMEAQIFATESQKASVAAERNTLEVQIEQVEDQIWKCSIRNPIKGTILTKYKEAGEMTSPGQPLFKLANLDELILRAYVSGDQLSNIGINKSVTVRFDKPEGMGELEGVVEWISPRAEFTPKIIQTKEERVNLVYAIKVVVPNNGQLKIGMPGEVVF